MVMVANRHESRAGTAPPSGPEWKGIGVERGLFNKVRIGMGTDDGRRGAIRRCGVICAVGLGLFHLLCPFSIGVVQGSSMTPTYRPGQFFLLDRHYYRDHPIQREDVVVARCDGHTMIKRVFAVGGDTIWLLVQHDNDTVFRFIVDRQMLDRLRRATLHGDIGRITRLTVPRGSVYLLGDYSPSSVDSRNFGAVSTDAIVGRVRPLRTVVVAIPLRSAGA
jgi:signal peptidase I